MRTIAAIVIIVAVSTPAQAYCSKPYSIGGDKAVEAINYLACVVDEQNSRIDELNRRIEGLETTISNLDYTISKMDR